MKKLKYVIIGLGILVVIGMAVYLTKDSNLVKVEVYKVKRDDITSFIEEIASVKANNQRIIYSKGAEEVLKLDVSVGKNIKKGDVIAVLNSEETDLQIKSLQAKKDALYATYNEAIKLPAQEIIDNTEANVRSKEILVESAKSDAEKAEALFNEGAISKENFQDTLNNYELQQEALKVAKNELENIKRGPSENIKKQYEAQLSDLDYQIGILKENKGNAFIHSPIDGVVLETYVKEGSYLQPGVPVIEIANNEELYLESDILVSEVGDIVEGAKVIVYSDDLEIEGYMGEVTKIHPKAFNKVSDLGIEQKRVKTEIDLDETIDILKVGYEVNVKIVTDEKKGSIVVPDSAIFDFEDGDYIYVVDESNAVLRKVETGIEGEDIVEITSGLNEGDIVILRPDENIKEGVQVNY